MADWETSSDVPAQNARDTSAWHSPSSAGLSSDRSTDSAEAWTSPLQPHSSSYGMLDTESRLPTMALPFSDHKVASRRTRAAATEDTPGPAEAGPSGPAYAAKKPPRLFDKQPKQYEQSNLSDLGPVPVNWIGDSTGHADYRPANVASFSNQAADIVRVATFSTVGQKHDDTETVPNKQDMCHSRPRHRRGSVWALLGVAAGTAIGVAYKVLGDRLDLDISAFKGQQIRRHLSTRHHEAPVSTGM